MSEYLFPLTVYNGCYLLLYRYFPSCQCRPCSHSLTHCCNTITIPCCYLVTQLCEGRPIQARQSSDRLPCGKESLWYDFIGTVVHKKRTQGRKVKKTLLWFFFSQKRVLLDRTSRWYVMLALMLVYKMSM